MFEDQRVEFTVDDLSKMAGDDIDIDAENPTKEDLEAAQTWLNEKLEDGLLPCLECYGLFEPERDSARIGDKCPDCRPEQTTPEKVQLMALNMEHGLMLLSAGDGGIVIELDEQRPSLERFDQWPAAIEFFQSCVQLSGVVQDRIDDATHDDIDADKLDGTEHHYEKTVKGDLDGHE